MSMLEDIALAEACPYCAATDLDGGCERPEQCAREGMEDARQQAEDVQMSNDYKRDLELLRRKPRRRGDK